MEAIEEICVPVVNALLEIPKSAVELTLEAKIYHEGKIICVTDTLDLEDLRAAIRNAEENYISDDTTYCLTEYGKKPSDELEAESASLNGE